MNTVNNDLLVALLFGLFYSVLVFACRYEPIRRASPFIIILAALVVAVFVTT
jgi:ABC-type multidrug transport system permease subunit